MKLSLLTTVMVMLVTILAISTPAGVPANLSYQGRLLDAAGVPVANGNYLIQFRIYDAAAAGNTLWNSQLRQIDVADGLFSYNLGDTVAIPHDLFLKYSSLWLGIRVGTGLELGPRIKLTSAGFAYQSLRSDSAFTLGGQRAGYYLAWANLTGMPAGFADGIDDTASSMDWSSLTNVPLGFSDGVDNLGTGTISGVTAGSGLTGGGVHGPVTLNVVTGSGIKLAADSIYIAKNSLTSLHLGINSVTASEIAVNAVGASEIAANAVGASEIAANAVGTSEVADNSLTSNDLAPGSVGSSEIVNGSIGDADISGTADIATSKIAGTAVNLSSTQTITGTKTFNDLKVATTTRRLSIAPPAFQAPSPGAVQFTYSLTNGLSPYALGANFSFMASVSLPEGAVVTQLEGYFYDMDPGDWRLRLVRIGPASTATFEVLADISTTGSPGYTNATDNTIATSVIDNENYVYMFLLQGTSFVGSSVYRFHGAEIEYTITRPLP